jgi:leader peptidase (prepilin peptidase)/N-methyltransferase
MDLMTELDDALPMLLVGLFSLAIGSFLNVVIYRLPLMLQRSWRRDCIQFLDLPSEGEPPEPFNLVLPNSFCPACHTGIKPRHNIPLLGYMWLRGRCAHCGTAIPLRYPLVEILTAVVSVTVVWQFGWSVQSILGLLLSWILIALSMIDLEHHLLPDTITLPGLWLGLVSSLGGWLSDPASSILGACMGYGVLWLVYHLFRLATGKQGMGYGDFKLLAMLGGWLGWSMIPAIVLISSTLGAAIGVALIATKARSRNQPIPFGPYLALAGWIALMWGPQLNAAYLQWLGPAG